MIAGELYPCIGNQTACNDDIRTIRRIVPRFDDGQHVKLARCDTICACLLPIDRALTLWTPEDGIPTLRKLPYAPEYGIPSERFVTACAGRRYTCGTVYNRPPPEYGIQCLFSNAYWSQHSGVIELQTRQQLKNNCFRETQRIFMNKFCSWTPSGQRMS